MGTGSSGLGKAGGKKSNSQKLATADEVLKKIDKIVDGYNYVTKEINVPYPYASKPPLDYIEYFYDNEDDGKYETVQMKNVRKVQPTVDVNVLRSKIKKQGIEDVISNKNSENPELPLMLKIDNEYLVLDGNHRTTIAYLAGAKKIRALVVEYKP